MTEAVQFSFKQPEELPHIEGNSMSSLEATGGVPGPGRIGRVAIGDILRKSAIRFADRIALTDGARQVDYKELDRDANRFANYLVARGLKPGDKISTICNNSVEFVKALFGIHRAGLVWVPINTMLGPGDMSYILDHAGVKFALIDDNLHAQPERRAALEQRGVALVAVDLTGKAAEAGLKSFAELIEGQS
jgi:long-chain acyl-CoA synthetase